MQRRLVVLAVVAMGCRGSKCKDALEHFALPSSAKVVAACQQDGWTEAQLACIKQAPNWTGLDFCSLSEAQRTHVAAAVAGEDPTSAARATVRRYVAAYPAWHADHPRDPCPAILFDLAKYTAFDPKDPWGHDYDELCGRDLPPTVTEGIAVVSAGPDGVMNTADDIHSWE
jgi:hypothetical protein